MPRALPYVTAQPPTHVQKRIAVPKALVIHLPAREEGYSLPTGQRTSAVAVLLETCVVQTPVIGRVLERGVVLEEVPRKLSGGHPGFRIGTCNQ